MALQSVPTHVANDVLPSADWNKAANDINFLVVAGADLASNGTITPTAGFHKVTGTTTIDNLTPVSPVAGQQHRLWFTEALTIRNNGGGSGNIRTASGSDIAIAANVVLTFTYDGAVWRESGPRLVVNSDVSTSAAIAATKIASAIGLASASADINYLKGNSGRVDFGGTAGVTGAIISAVGTPDGVEFGHSNSAGYRGTLGARATDGRNYLVFHGEGGSTANTFKTRGCRATILLADTSGGVQVCNVPTASADNQSPVVQVTIDNGGNIRLQGDSYYAMTATSNGHHVETGYAYAITGGGTSVSFSRAFASTPRPITVMAQEDWDTSQNGGSGAPANGTAWPKLPSTTSFTVGHTQGGTRSVYWMAEG